MPHLAPDFAALGFNIYATAGTPVIKLFKLAEGRPHVLDMIKNGEVSFTINTSAGKTPRDDEVKILLL